MLEVNKIYNQDCLEGMKYIDDKSIDMILCDLPYGTTACKWDTIIPFDKLWIQYERIIKQDRAIVLTGSQPFTSELIHSNLKLFKYEWIWLKKRFNSGFAHAKNKPLKKHENIVVFSYGNTIHKSQSKNRMMYNPQGLVPTVRKRKTYSTTDVSFGKRPSHRDTIQEYTNYPQSIIEFDLSEIDLINNKPIHPTQKPVALFEYLIKTYTNEGEVVLDNCIGSGTTAIACINTKRNYIGFELDEHYYEVAKERIDKIII